MAQNSVRKPATTPFTMSVNSLNIFNRIKRTSRVIRTRRASRKTVRVFKFMFALKRPTNLAKVMKESTTATKTITKSKRFHHFSSPQKCCPQPSIPTLIKNSMTKKTVKVNSTKYQPVQSCSKSRLTPRVNELAMITTPTTGSIYLKQMSLGLFSTSIWFLTLVRLTRQALAILSIIVSCISISRICMRESKISWSNRSCRSSESDIISVLNAKKFRYPEDVECRTPKSLLNWLTAILKRTRFSSFSLSVPSSSMQ
mmetsp:Transcript_111171/g.202127  ORF Transcript_111171/g.202127 Transcript_111171/m.202127 type:complete len:256 (+) Transcript_111171:1030-1797(+)